jgi:FlgD Ig-like domain
VRRTANALLVLSFVAASGARAQTDSTVQRAQELFDGFDFPRALVAGRAALEHNLNDEDRATAYAVVGFSLGALDSTGQAVQALQQFILLDPDRVPDTDVLGPRLVDLYNQAWGLVLVVRRPTVDTTTFVLGQGAARIRFEVSRPSIVTTTILGGGARLVVDSQLVNPGAVSVSWDARAADGGAVPAGRYQILVTAMESRNQYQALGGLAIDHAAVDTVAHISSMAGLEELPEMERPPRDWRPLGLSVVLAGVAGGLALALDNSGLGGTRRELVAGGGLTIGVGMALSLRRPDPRPVPANIRYNAQVQRLIAERNDQITAQNVALRREVLVHVRPVTP